MATLNDVLNKLRVVYTRGELHGCLCPVHGDKKPSLYVKGGDDGRVLMWCMAGCTIDQITAAIGLTVRDLFGKNSNPREKTYRGQRWQDPEKPDEVGLPGWAHAYDEPYPRQPTFESPEWPYEERVYFLIECYHSIQLRTNREEMVYNTLLALNDVLYWNKQCQRGVEVPEEKHPTRTCPTICLIRFAECGLTHS